MSFCENRGCKNRDVKNRRMSIAKKGGTVVFKKTLTSNRHCSPPILHGKEWRGWGEGGVGRGRGR